MTPYDGFGASPNPGSVTKDETGKIYGRLTVIRRNGKSKTGLAMWECRCECGTEITTRGADLRNGKARSCGCIARELNAKRMHERPTTIGTYGAVHRAVRRERGSASNHLCVDCGARADDWSYEGGSPDEQIQLSGTNKGCRFTPDLSYYVARCTPCHARKDAPTHCHRGHAFTPENTYVRRDGSRQCRACVRISRQLRKESA